MSSWNNIPQEILEQIFSHLYNNDELTNHGMIQCQLACKNWCGPAQKQLYKAIDLNSITEAKVASFFQTVSSTPSDITPGKLVKVLNIGDYFSKESIFKTRNPISVNYFINLQSLFPNLEHLLAKNASEIFWTKLIHERYNGNWLLLRGIPTSSPMDFANYAYAAVACCSTLESLTLFYQPFRGRPDSRLELHICTLTQNMKRFTNLKNLVIKIGEDFKGFLEYDSLIQDCCSLQSLTFHVGPSNGSTRITSATSTSDDRAINLSLIEPRQYIKYFEGSNCISSSYSAIYFIHKFPNLQKLILTNKSSRFDFLSMPVKKRFFQNAAQVPDFRLTYRDLGIRNRSNLLDAFLEAIHGADLIVNIKYASRLPPQQQQTFTICSRSEYIEDDDNEESILYQNKTIHYNKYYESRYEEQLSILLGNKVILKYGTQTQKLCVDANSTKNMTGTDIASNLDINYMLQDVYENCPFLHCLTLCNMNLAVCASSLLVTNNQSITRLEIIRSYFMDRYALNNICVRLSSLNYLVLDKCTFSSYSEEEDNIVSMYLGRNVELDALTLSMDGPLKKVYLEVLTAGRSRDLRYFELGDHSWNPLLSMDEYTQLLNDSHCWTISIYCKRLSLFTICFDNGVQKELQLVVE